MRKNNGDIRLCIDFRNLNRALEKDNYPMPLMEQILQCVPDSKMLSLLDDFSGYNQVLVAHEDQLKTAFRTKWGTYAYMKMSFGLINARATFQRAMNITFGGLLGECVKVYLNDVTIFSRDKKDHITHLKKIFNRFKRYGISPNPKKSVFAVDEAKILGFIVSKHGMEIEPERTEFVSMIPPPHKKKTIQSFPGIINFVRQFIPSFTEIVKPMQDIIKKNAEFRWGSKEK
jgi:hypothetical protein